MDAASGQVQQLLKEGEAKRLQGRYDEAIAYLDKALQIDSRSAFALGRRGEAKRRKGLYDEAIADFNQSLQIEPRSAFALQGRGDAKRRKGLYDEAIADLDQVLEIEPRSAFALQGRGDAKRMKGSYDEAIADFDQALQIEPRGAFALRGRAEAKRRKGLYNEAIADYDQALQIDPEDAFALRGRSAAKQEQGRYGEAIEDLDHVLHLQPEDTLTKQQMVAVASNPQGAWWQQRLENVKSMGDKKMRIANSTVDIIGAGPVGLCLAISLAKIMSRSQTRPPATPPITVHEIRWITEENGHWRRKPSSRARDQVVTLQDAVVDLFPDEVGACLEGERVWLHSRNIPVSQIEDRALQKVQEPPFSSFVRLKRTERLDSREAQADFIKGLDSDFIVAADGAGSLSRQAFKGAFVCPQSKGYNAKEERIRLGATDDNLVEVDYALGIILLQDVHPPQPQSLNVVMTLAQNVYLLNSQKGSKGFMNIRITQEEYDAIYRATRNHGCPFGSPIQLDFPEDVGDGSGQPFAKVKLPWLQRRIEEGLKLFGMRKEHMVGITGFQLIPAYVEHFCHVLPADGNVKRPRVLLLGGDAAISHHFWPGRGLNTGLKSAWAITRMFESETVVDGLQRYNKFMMKLRLREMQGRSASMLVKSLRLDWGEALIRNDPGDGAGAATGEDAAEQEKSCLGCLWGKRPQAASDHGLIQKSVAEQEQNRQKFLRHCKLWRDLLERAQEAWPHKPIDDMTLEARILTAVLKPKPLELRLMVQSAAPNGEGRAAGWPTSGQGGPEVDPGEDWHWK